MTTINKTRVAQVAKSGELIQCLVYKPEGLVRTYSDASHLDARMYQVGEKDDFGRPVVWAKDRDEVIQFLREGKCVVATVESLHQALGWGYHEFYGVVVE